MRISVVIPIYNEVESLWQLQRALRQALDGIADSWEAVLVDDGSRDGSTALLEQMAVEDPEHLTVIIFKRNYGQTAAIAAGIDHAAGEVIVLMDADLQNDPADIPLLLTRLDQGYDAVCGWRVQRKDTFLTRRVPSMIANRLISQVTGVHLHDYGCTLKIFRREFLTGFNLYGEMHRFIPVYAVWAGARITEVPVRHHPRRFGQTKYGLGRTLRVVQDLLTVRALTRYQSKPGYLFAGTGAWLLGLACFALLVLAIGWRDWHHLNTLSWLVPLAVVLGVGGLQCFLMGVLAEMIARTGFAAEHKPAYQVKRVIRADHVTQPSAP